MLAAVTNALRVPEIRNRILFTAAILLLYRAGSWLPTPGVNTAEIQNLFNGEAGSTILGYLNLFSGQALQNLSFFALGIMPYITASIIMQLMTVVLPKLEGLQKEGLSDAWHKYQDVMKRPLPSTLGTTPSTLGTTPSTLLQPRDPSPPRVATPRAVLPPGRGRFAS